MARLMSWVGILSLLMAFGPPAIVAGAPEPDGHADRSGGQPTSPAGQAQGPADQPAAPSPLQLARPAMPGEPVLHIYPLSDLYDREITRDELDADTPGLFKPFLSNLDFYARSGVAFPFGDGYFENIFEPSWKIQGGVMRPLLRSDGQKLVITAELGGELVVGGGTGSAPRSGVFFTPEEGIEFPLDPMGWFHLSEFRQVSVVLAAGAYYRPGWHCWWREKAMQLHLRGGLRLGRVRSKLLFQPTDALQGLVDDRIGLGMDSDRFQFRNPDENIVVNDAGQVTVDDTNRSDSFVGLFTSVGWSLVRRDVRLGSWRLGDVSLGLEAEFAHDWFRMDVDGDIGLGTFSTLMTLTITH